MRRSARARRHTEHERHANASPSDALAQSPWLELQRLLGNRFVQRFLGRGDREDRAYDDDAADRGRSLEGRERAELESTVGEDLGDVRVHEGPDTHEAARALDATAFSTGKHIHLGAEASRTAPDERARGRTLAHEAIHVLQRRRARLTPPRRPVTEPGEPAEREATSAAASQAGQRPTVSAVPSGIIARQPTPPTAKGTTSEWPGLERDVGPPPTHVFEHPQGNTPAGARRVLDQYNALTPGVRTMAFDYSYPRGSVAKVLKALPAADAEGTYREVVTEILRRVEEAETRIASGKTDEQMADVEAAWEHARYKAAAARKLGHAPTDAEIEQMRREAQSRRSFHHPAVKTRWEKLSTAKKAEWTADADKAIAALVAHAASAHPSLKLTAADFKHAFHEIDKNSPGAFAQAGESGGRPVVEIGFEFVEAVKVDPAYALSTVVHELRGHREFDSPGGDTWQLTLYRKAARKIPGYTADPTAEAASYGYHASEIYSLLRELPYWTPVAAKHKKFEHLNPDPKTLIAAQLTEIMAEWEPALAVTLVRALYRRFSLDPRLDASALQAFKDAIKAKFSAADAAQILK
jgi:hypothetical protein